MKVICAPDKFKGSLSAIGVAEAMLRGVAAVDPQAGIDLCPIADGGEGTVDAMLAATGGQPMTSRVAGPLVDWTEARWGLLGRREGEPLTAVVEMAAASGLVLLPVEQRDPTRTTTLGTGQLIRAALDAGATRIVVGIGGSATTDAGCGMAAGLGVRFLDALGRPIPREELSGGQLHRIERIDPTGRDARLDHCEVIAACDVTNPLHGRDGAARVYAPQKGARPEQVALLDDNLAHIARLVREQLGIDVQSIPGSGAAGGLGAGLLAFAGASLRSGADLVLDAVGFDRRVVGCGLCLTGEGRLDGQSLSGKAVIRVAQRAARAGVPTVALVGSADESAEHTLEQGLRSYHVVGQGLAPDESMRRAAELVEAAARRVAQTAAAHP